MLPDFSLSQWVLALVAALGVGISKSGLPGISLLHILIFAELFPGLASTGVVLPMLIAGDLGAVWLFRRHAQWSHVARTLPPAVVGVVAGWGIMRWAQATGVPGVKFNFVIGGIVLALACVQLGRNWRPLWFADVPHTRAFAVTMGFIAGVTTMMANAAGPVMALYLLAVALPKDQFVGTSAWFFLLINLIKVPFSAQLGLITGHTLLFNLVLVPVIGLGLLVGRLVVAKLPQRGFDSLVLAFAILAATKLLGAF
ncbi:MAG TPA: sulfite exporter TauE/SafE family protein [Verrucomicrobiota bacterium]|nr:sulfite exporter TauE/SafE family protein [Verrucomicrobiota bacterium]